MTIVALDPTGGPVDGPRTRALAPRPPSIDGQRVGVVINGLGASEQLFDALCEELRALADVDVVKVVKAGVSVPPDPGDWSRLTEGATVAITGFGG